MIVDNDNLVHKTCTKCGEEKLLSHFRTSSKGKLGARSDCKSCEKLRRQKYYESHRDEEISNAKEWRLSNLDLSKSASAKWAIENKEKIIELGRKWRSDNPKRIKEIKRRDYEKHKEKRLETAKLWRDRNPEKVREFVKNATSNRKSDPAKRLNHSISSGVRSGLVDVAKSGRSTFSLLGYSPADLRNHLEKQFTTGMTWENYGEWHVDHVIPKSVFNFETVDDIDFKRCWSLSNLQPLWATDNRKKSAKLTTSFQPSLPLAVNDNQPRTMTKFN